MVENTNNNWTELMNNAQKLHQQLQEIDKTVQITITADYINFSKERGTVTKKIAAQHKLNQAITQSFDNNLTTSFQNGNVLEEIQYFWQKLKTLRRKSRTKNIELHFQIGASLF